MGKLIEINRPKPASSPEVVEFLQELLILAYDVNIEIVLVGTKSANGMEADGVVAEGETSRNVDRVLDMLEEWAKDREYDYSD